MTAGDKVLETARRGVPSFERARHTLYDRAYTTAKQRDAALHDLITLYTLSETTEETRDTIVRIFLDAEDEGDIRGNVSWRISEEAPGIRESMNALLDVQWKAELERLGKNARF